MHNTNKPNNYGKHTKTIVIYKYKTAYVGWLVRWTSSGSDDQHTEDERTSHNNGQWSIQHRCRFLQSRKQLQKCTRVPAKPNSVSCNEWLMSVLLSDCTGGGDPCVSCEACLTLHLPVLPCQQQVWAFWHSLGTFEHVLFIEFAVPWTGKFFLFFVFGNFNRNWKLNLPRHKVFKLSLSVNYSVIIMLTPDTDWLQK